MPDGDLASQASLSNDDGQQRAVDPLQMRDQSRLDAIARQPHRAPLQQRFGRNTHHCLEEIDGGVAPKHVVQPLAETDPRRRGVMNRRCDQFAAAEFEEGSVADAM